MTDAHRDAILTLSPGAAAKVNRLDPTADIPDPHGKPPHAYEECAERLREVILQRLPAPAVLS
jgi:protein-tyrosine-phosphatase